ncbi:MAG: hypothetical protein EBQ66_10805 [Flavobacteriia bacterium]|nr:hypothetical protein [Flavobacteriia bacterium]
MISTFGIVLFLLIFGMAFWLLLFLLGFVVPYWITLESLKNYVLSAFSKINNNLYIVFSSRISQ